jgi:outer membrane protein assembly factor BamB
VGGGASGPEGDDGTENPLPAAAGRVIGCGSVGCLGVVLLSVVGLVASVVFAVFAAEDSVNEAFDRASSAMGPSGSVVVPLTGLDGVVVDGGGDQPVEVASAVFDARADQRHLARVRLGSPDLGRSATVVWRSEPLPNGVYEAPMALAGDVLFAGVGAEVWALSVDGGEVRWKAPLPDTVQAGCTSCFVVVGDTLVVRTNDAQVVAHQAASAEPRWTRRLESTNGSVVPSGAGLAVVDHPPGDTLSMGVTVVDPATGSTVSQHRPSCTLGSRTLGFGFTDEVYAVPGTTDLVATVSFGGTCVVRWDGTTGEVRWTTAVDQPASLRREPALLGGGRLFLSSSDAAFVVDLETGALAALPAPPDTGIEPGAVVGDVLVATAPSTRGTPRRKLVGIDLTAMTVLWELPLVPGAAPFTADRRTADALFSGSPRIHVTAARDRALVATFDGDTGAVTLSLVDPRTGVLTTAGAVPFGSRSGIPSVQVHRATRAGILFSVDNRLVYVDEGGEVQRWPA